MNFSDYAKHKLNQKRVASSLGFKLVNVDESVKLLNQSDLLKKATALKEETEIIIKGISIDSEIAIREFLIAPVLKLIYLYFKCEVFIEYFLESENIKGKLDYLLEKENDFLIVEAKKDDFDGGGKQLMAQFSALATVEKKEIYGAVSNGRFWQFYQLNLEQNVIYKNVNFIRFPEDSSELVSKIAEIFSN